MQLQRLSLKGGVSASLKVAFEVHKRCSSLKTHLPRKSCGWFIVLYPVLGKLGLLISASEDSGARGRLDRESRPSG